MGQGTSCSHWLATELIRLSVEAIELTLKDVTRPYVAPSKKAPSHPE